ncbi:hypothetical protein N9446_00910 [bacterium]|jgi:hypothetical protein|nr:hypothetical protein [bacterium]
MAVLSQSVAKGVRVYEAEVTLPTASGTVTAVSIPANCLVLSAGCVVTEACAGSSGHAADLSIGSADIVTALNLQTGSVGDIITEAAVPQGTTAADTIDVVSTVTGTGTAGKVRVFALVVDMDAPRTADEVDRDTLA